MSAWLLHLELSPYCHRNHAIYTVGEYDVCQCGWMGKAYVPSYRQNPKGMTFGELAASKGYKYDGHSRHECEEYSVCPQHKTTTCCSDPCIRGGRCDNCDTWVSDNHNISQGDNEG